MIRFLGGERFSVVVDDDGAPVSIPNLYLLTMSRQNDALNTMKAKARTIAHFYKWCKINNIDIESRFSKNKLLSIDEINSMCEYLRLDYNYNKTQIDKICKLKSYNNKKIINLNFKLGKNKNLNVCNETYNQRINYIKDYLSWLVNVKTIQKNFIESEYANIIIKRNEMIDLIKSRNLPSRNQESPKGFEDVIRGLLIDIINPDSEYNPFRDKFVKTRNEIFVLIALSAGLRRGEMLKMKVEHVDLVNKRIMVERCPDDVTDTRGVEPNVKTKERYIRIENSLVIPIREYLKDRRGRRLSKTHPFFFVARSGAPLSYTQAGDIYIKLRNCDLGLPSDLSQHEIRHAWNYKFSAMAKERGVSDTEADNLRKNQMGWSKNSLMPFRYNKRYIQEKSDELSLQLQKEIMDHRSKSKIEKDKE